MGSTRHGNPSKHDTLQWTGELRLNSPQATVWNGGLSREELGVGEGKEELWEEEGRKMYF